MRIDKIDVWPGSFVEVNVDDEWRIYAIEDVAADEDGECFSVTIDGDTKWFGVKHPGVRAVPASDHAARIGR